MPLNGRASTLDVLPCTCWFSLLGPTVITSTSAFLNRQQLLPVLRIKSLCTHEKHLSCRAGFAGRKVRTMAAWNKFSFCRVRRRAVTTPYSVIVSL